MFNTKNFFKNNWLIDHVSMIEFTTQWIYHTHHMPMLLIQYVIPCNTNASSYYNLQYQPNTATTLTLLADLHTEVSSYWYIVTFPDSDTL